MQRVQLCKEDESSEMSSMDCMKQIKDKDNRQLAQTKNFLQNFLHSGKYRHISRSKGTQEKCFFSQIPYYAMDKKTTKRIDFFDFLSSPIDTV